MGGCDYSEGDSEKVRMIVGGCDSDSVNSISTYR